MDNELFLFAVASDGHVEQWDGTPTPKGILLRWFALQEHGFPDFGYRLYRAPSKITTSLLSWDAVDIPRGSTTYTYSPEVLLKCAGFGVRHAPDSVCGLVRIMH